MSMQQEVEPSGRPLGDLPRERLLTAMPVTERRLHLAGISTPVLEGGDGQPVVLLHGPGEFAANWMRIIPKLVRSHRVIAPDLPGHGASEVVDGPLDADHVFAWLGELIKRTCSSPPALVGHLLGGAIGARFASDHGDMLSRLVLVDGYGLSRLWPTPRFAISMIAFVARPTEGTQDRLFASAWSTWMGGAGTWVSSGRRSKRTLSTAPAPPAGRPPSTNSCRSSECRPSPSRTSRGSPFPRR